MNFVVSLPASKGASIVQRAAMEDFLSTEKYNHNSANSPLTNRNKPFVLGLWGVHTNSRKEPHIPAIPGIIRPSFIADVSARAKAVGGRRHLADVAPHQGRSQNVARRRRLRRRRRLAAAAPVAAPAPSGRSRSGKGLFLRLGKLDFQWLCGNFALRRCWHRKSNQVKN